MISILKTDVPGYLRTSPLFANAFSSPDEIPADGEEQHIEVPGDCFKSTPDVLSESDLYALFKTVRFWVIPEYVESSSQFLSFVLTNKEVLDRLISEFQNDFPFLTKLHTTVQPSTTSAILKNALQVGLLGLIQHLHETGTPLQAQGFTSFTSLAAQHGHTNCLAYGLQNGCVLKGNECRLAVMGGHLGAFRYAAEHGCVITTSTLALAAELNRSEILKCACERGVPLDITLSSAAIAKKSLECLRVLITHSCPVPESGCETTVVSGAFDCLRCLHEGGAPWSPALVSAAIRHKRIACLEYLLNEGCPVDSAAAVLAARRADLACLTCLHEHGVAHWSPEVVNAAIKGNSFACMVYALDQGSPYSADVCARAVRTRNLNFLTCLCERGAQLTEGVTRAALQFDCPIILKYALDHGCPLGDDACLMAVMYGYQNGLEGLRMAHQHGAPWSEEVVRQAIERRSCDQVIYALRRGCPFNADACVQAARVGSVKVLKCLHEENRAAITQEVVNAAKLGRHMECIAYAIAHSDLVDNFTNCATAAGQGDIVALLTLRERGAQWDERTCLAAIRSNALECLQYAVKNGCPVDASLPAEAARHGNLGMLSFLIEVGCPWDITTAIAAVQVGSQECLQYVVVNGCNVDATLPAEAARHGNLGILIYLFEVGCPWDGRTTAAAVQSGSRECLDFALCKNCPFEVV